MKRIAALFLALMFCGHAEAATLYLSEFVNGVSSVGSTLPQIYPQPSITDQTVALSASSAQSAAFGSSTRAILAVCDEGCSVLVGTNPTATTSNYLLFQGQAAEFAVAPGQKIAVVANAAGNSGGGGGLGTVTSLTPGSANIVLTPNPITTTGTIDLAANITVTALSAFGGNVRITRPSASTATLPALGLTVNGGSYSGLFQTSNDFSLQVTANGVEAASIGNGPIRVPSTSGFGWVSGAATIGATDLALFRDAANTLALRNVANAQTFNVYGSFTDVSNKDYLSIGKAAGGDAFISTIKAGTGTAANLNLTAATVILTGTPKWAGTNSTGAGSALLGANSPASTLTAPYTWITVTTSDGSTGYMPVWK